jgi:hypothetical protein
MCVYAYDVNLARLSTLLGTTGALFPFFAGILQNAAVQKMAAMSLYLLVVGVLSAEEVDDWEAALWLASLVNEALASERAKREAQP